MVIHIGNPNPQPIQANTYTQREVDLTNEVNNLTERLKNEAFTNSYNNLEEDKFFRYKLLEAINNLTKAVENVPNKIMELSNQTE